MNQTYVYLPQIPTGVARSKGYGSHFHVIVVESGQNFKTLNSAHTVKKSFGVIRYDGDKPTLRSRLGRILQEVKAAFPSAVPFGNAAKKFYS